MCGVVGQLCSVNIQQASGIHATIRPLARQASDQPGQMPLEPGRAGTE